MLVADPRLQVIPSFQYRAEHRLAELSRLLVALQLTEAATSPYIEQVLRDARYLRHGLRTLTRPGALTLDQQRYVVERLLPMIPESSAAGAFVPPTDPTPDTPTGQVPLALTLDTLPPKVRGAATTPLTVSGTVRGTLPAGAQLVVQRDGITISSQVAAAGTYSVVDATPGLTYAVAVTGTTLRRQASRQLASPLLAGVLPDGASPDQVAALPSFYPGLTNGVGRFSFTGARNRIYLGLPVAVGTVLKFTQPNDNDADITAAFTPAPMTLDFGTDGSDAYQVFENFADFLGDFTLDVHVQLASA